MKRTWVEAADICKDYGGYLPWFGSKRSIHEFLSLLKLSPDIPRIITTTYIGLRVDKKEVSKAILKCTNV